MEKRWRCTVCGYIHTGDEPPAECPVCKQGPEVFVLIEEKPVEDSKIDKKQVQQALFSISYGLYIVGSKLGDKLNAQVCNTVFQVTSDPLQVLIGINKQNLTHQYITTSGIVTIGVLGQDGHDLVSHFGYQTGHKADKFANMEYILGETEGPLVNGCIAYFEGKVVPGKTVDAGTHSLFLMEVTAGKTVSDAEPMTYAYYRKTRK
ncbi:MAG: flavin reductase [Bacillota bacterium]|nr:flavin reductase [Bacillota bacterium]